MKLMLYDVDFNGEIDFEDGCILSVECESKEYFAKLISTVKGSRQGSIALYDGLEQVSFDNDVLAIIDYYALGMYEKSAMTKLYKNIEKINATDNTLSGIIDKIMTLLSDLAGNATDGMNLNFEINPPESLVEYLKFANLSVEGGFSSGINGVLNFICVVSLLKLYKVLVLVNAKSFFDKQQVQEIIKCCTYNHQKVLFIDNLCEKSHFDNEKKILIDEDFYDMLIK